MSDPRVSYVIIRRENHTISHYRYRGALRVERDTVVWECSDVHDDREQAKKCAISEIRRRAAQPPPAVPER